MSFGWSAGDLATAVELSNDIYNALTKSTDEYEEFARWLERLTAILQLFHNDYKTIEQQSWGFSPSEEESTQEQEIVKTLRMHVDSMLATLARYLLLDSKEKNTNLTEWCMRQGRKLQWKFLDREEVIKKQNDVSHYLDMLEVVILARSRRNHFMALSTILDTLHANHRSQMNMAADSSRSGDKVYDLLVNLTNMLTNFILASGKIPDSRPLATALSPDLTDDARSTLELLEHQVPASSLRPAYEVDASFKIGRWIRDVLEEWLSPGAKNPCLWIQDENSKRFSQELVGLQHQMQLPVVYYRCEKKDAHGKWIEPEQSLHGLSCSFVHQLLYYTVSRQLPIPINLGLERYKDLDLKSYDSTVALISLAGDLVDESTQLIWVIDGFERLEDEVVRDNESHMRALDRLLTLIGATKSQPSDQSSTKMQRSLITTQTRPRLLKKYSLNNDIKLAALAFRSDANRYIFADELRGMLLRRRRDT